MHWRKPILNISYSVMMAALFFAIVIVDELGSQQSLDPAYTPFEGSVYQLPFDSLPKGYRPYVEYLVPSKHITWDSIFVPKTSSDTPFPDVDYKVLFGIIFHSQMDIPVDGRYEFILVSDDGSRLWIDDRLVLNNDRPHGMRIKRDTIALRQGTYPIKIWYYQAYPTLYGLMYASNYLGPAEFESADSIIWDGDVLFDFDDYNLSERGRVLLDSLMLIIEDRKIEKIEILGHTDDFGPLDYNYDLSHKRAQTIMQYLSNSDLIVDINLEVVGHGETLPRAPNDSAANRAKNRRVELVMH